jgi:hypothetical protein
MISAAVLIPAGIAAAVGMGLAVRRIQSDVRGIKQAQRLADSLRVKRPPQGAGHG